jgi:hypothetical protein
MFRNFVLIGTWLLFECVLLVTVGACVFIMDEIGCFESLVLHIGADVIRVYVVDADGHVSSCLCGLYFLAICGGLTGSVLICCSLLISF